MQSNFTQQFVLQHWAQMSPKTPLHWPKVFYLNYLVLHALSQAISLCFYSQCKCCLSKRLVWYSNNWLSCSAVFVGKTIVNASLLQVGLHGIVVGVGEITGGLLFGIFGHFLTKKGGRSIKPFLPQPRQRKISQSVCLMF